jgi:glycosyltransferase involved in cell wall biosynthesis
MPIVSIIVPIHNTEKYLCRCVDSILAQSFTDFECILINDGSVDGSPSICDAYSVRDSRIVVIHQQNRGVSAARNAGLDIARGEWISFVDSDDWCEPEMFAILYENAVREKADVSICGVKRVGNSKSLLRNKKRHGKHFFSGFRALLIMYSGKMFDTSAFAKMVHSKFFFERKIRYDERICYSEDALLYYEIFKNATRVVCSTMSCYNYFINPDSITGIKELTKERKTAFLAYDKMLSLEGNKKIRDKILARKVREAYFMSLYYIVENSFTDSSFIFLQNIIKNNIIYIIKDFSFSVMHKMLCCAVLYPKFACLLYELYKICKRSSHDT